MKNLTLSLAAIGTLSLLALMPSKAQIIITEVDASGSSSSGNSYNQDWFELTNEGSSSVSISGWKMDDNHNSFAASVALNGVSSISAGQSVVFLEDTGSSSDATLDAAFETAWFGSSVPAGFAIGNYGGSSVGLSQTADSVNIYNASGVLQAGVTFGASTAGTSFDNSVAKLSGTTGTGSSDPTISTLSVVGVNGAFVSAGTGSAGTHEIGSPGAVPEPSSWALALLVAGGFAMLVRQQKAKRA